MSDMGTLATARSLWVPTTPVEARKLRGATLRRPPKSLQRRSWSTRRQLVILAIATLRSGSPPTQLIVRATQKPLPDLTAAQEVRNLLLSTVTTWQRLSRTQVLSEGASRGRATTLRTALRQGRIEPSRRIGALLARR